MRTFLNGAGADYTEAVKAHLAAHRELIFADLYVITTAPSFQGQYLGQTFLLTDYPSSLVWNYRGKFLPATIERGQVASKIGLEVDTLEVTWSPHDSDVLARDGSGNILLSAIQGFGCGIFDNGVVEVWRCLMPTPGDAASLGACLLFSGRIGNIEPDRLKSVMTVMSRLEVLNEMVPTNLIEPTNILAQYTTGQVLNNGPASFALVSGVPSVSPYAGLGADSGGGTSAWTSYTYIEGPPDAAYATTSVGASPHEFDVESNALDATAYGFSLATGAGIAGVGVTVTGSETAGVGGTASATLIYLGSPIGTPKIFAFPAVAAAVPLGGPSDSWGATLTPSIVNDPSFGVRFRIIVNNGTGFEQVAIAAIDAAQITLYGGSYLSPGTLIADPVTAPGGYAPANDLWTDGYVVMSSPGKTGGVYRGVRSQQYDGTHHIFFLYEPLPFAPQAGDTFAAFVYVPPDSAGAAVQGSDYQGFEFVPSPLDSAVVIA